MAMKPDGKSPITSKALSRRYFHQLISAVGYCHSRSVFHRDLKFHIISGSPGFNLFEMFSDRVERHRVLSPDPGRRDHPRRASPPEVDADLSSTNPTYHLSTSESRLGFEMA
ncbi:hypothetical protein DY000_02056785 [Brassica cretica]|uniref:Protein kinase domain-containing protein n=1 Tax=Brassica cretica TaxID=69181 RepID=A0ABQ7ABK0_BRACR|nr:hypothetical protein DY000_02056785 [Brassica cretica]